MILPLPSQRMALKAVLAGSCRPLAAPMSIKLMPSVVVATRMVMTSLFAFLGWPVTMLVSAQLGVLEQLLVVEALSCFSTYTTAVPRPILTAPRMASGFWRPAVAWAEASSVG